MEAPLNKLSSKPHFVLLDALRGVAAFIVVIYHIFEGFATSTQDQICNHGYLAVDFFFLLSGFVIGYAYDDRWKTLSMRHFFIRRLIRLHPMVLAGMVIGALAFIEGGCLDWDGQQVAMWRVLLTTVAGLLFIPAIPGSALDVRGFTEMFPLNGPAWSLFFEYIGNILYAILLRRLPLWALAMVVIASGSTLAWLVTGHGSLDYGWTLTSFWPGTMRLLFPYSFGLLLARLHSRYAANTACAKGRQWSTFFLCSVTLAILLPMPYVGTGEDTWPNGLYAILCVALVFPLVVWLAALSGGRGKTNGIFRFLADISFPLYLVHYPYMYLFYQYIDFPNVQTSPSEALPEALLTIFVSIVSAYLVMRFYDAPVRSCLTEKLIHPTTKSAGNKGKMLCITALFLSLGTSAMAQRMMFGDTSRVGKPYCKDPHVVHFKGRYLMYYSIPPRQWNGMEGWNIGIAESQDLVNWEKVGEITPQPGLEYEAKGLCAPGALVRKGKVHLFYQTYGNGPKDAICHAVSKDGINFHRDPTNPIFNPDPADWTCGRAIDAEVAYYKGKYYLYFATRDPEFKVQKLGVATTGKKSDFSRGSWTLATDNSILQPELAWEGECIEGASVCVKDGTMWLFYAGAYNNAPQQIGVASSTDGINFTRLSATPFKPNGKSGEWNSSESGHPHLFTDKDGSTYLFYQGNNDHGKTWLITQEEVFWDKANRPFLR